VTVGRAILVDALSILAPHHNKIKEAAVLDAYAAAGGEIYNPRILSFLSGGR
jgi:hypothetical protein